MQNLSEQDYELISAYLDNELSASERAAFDMRLAQETGLRAELEELRVVRSAVQALPALRAPRRFTLTPQMVGQAAAAPPRRVLRPRANWWLSAAAALVVAVVGVGVLLVSRNDQPPGGNQQIAALASATPESTTEMIFAAQASPPGAQPSPAPTQMMALTTPTEGSLAGMPAPQGTPAPADTLAGDMAGGGAASASGSAEASNQAGDAAQTARALPTDATPEMAEIFTFDTATATGDSAVMQMSLPQPPAAETGVEDAALSAMMSEPGEEQMTLAMAPKADPVASLLRAAAALVAALWSLLHP